MLKTIGHAADVTADTAEWTEGWYVVTGEVSIDRRVSVTGDVHLILADGCSLTVNGGIQVPETASLTITAQSAGENMGKLTAVGNSLEAGIGGGDGDAGGTITINGGTVKATGGFDGAGIGGGYESAGGTITISGGTVKATGGGFGAGIGGGYGGADGTITISGGMVTATGGGFGAGIGGGWGGAGGTITINGGTVKATGGFDGAGIGGGYKSAGGTIVISGGTVKATGGDYGAGIGSGYSGSAGAFSTGANGNAVIYAAGGMNASAISDKTSEPSWSGLIIEGAAGALYGSAITPEVDFEIPADTTVTIGANQTLIIPKGVTMTVNGNIVNNGKIVCYGTIDGAENISGNPVEYHYPEPEPEPIPTPDEPEEEGPIYTPSTPIPDGFYEYSLGAMFYRGGRRVKGLCEYAGAVYYFDQSGWMQTGWVEFAEGWRYFGEDGRMQTGWLKLGSVWYYLDPETGLMYADGLAAIGKSAYYFYDWGGMASDWWYEAEDGWYYFGGSGAMKTAQWLQWEGGWYYLTESGKMAVDTDIGGYYVNADGVWAG